LGGREKDPATRSRTSIAHVEQNVVAAKLNFTQEQLQQIENVAGRAFPSGRSPDQAECLLDNNKSAISFYKLS
jgi:hypothetical protein